MGGHELGCRSADDQQARARRRSLFLLLRGGSVSPPGGMLLAQGRLALHPCECGWKFPRAWRPGPVDSGLAHPGLGPGAESWGRRRKRRRDRRAFPVVGLIFGRAALFPSFTLNSSLLYPPFSSSLWCASWMLGCWPETTQLLCWSCLSLPVVSAAPSSPLGPRSSLLYVSSHLRPIPNLEVASQFSLKMAAIKHELKIHFRRGHSSQ